MSGYYSSFLGSINQLLGSSGTITGLVRDTANAEEGAFGTRIYNAIYNHKLGILSNGRIGLNLYREYASVLTRFMTSPSDEIIEVISDNAFLNLFESNQLLFEEIIEAIILSRIEPSAEEKASINKDVKKLVHSIVKCARDAKAVIEKHSLTTQVDIKNKFAEIITDKETDLYQDILNITDSSLDLVGHNLNLFSDLFYLNVLTPEVDIHQSKYKDVLRILGSLSAEQKSNVGKYFDSYRSPQSLPLVKEGLVVRAGAFLDDYVETYMHNRSLEGIDFQNTEYDNYNFDGFRFCHSKLSSIKFSNGKFLNCNFNYVTFNGPVEIVDCEIDAETFKTMLPSLRQAAARGIAVKIKCKIIGKVKSLDLRGFNSSEITVADSSVDVYRSERVKVIEDSYNEVLERTRIHHFLATVDERVAKRISGLNADNSSITAVMDSLESNLYNLLNSMSADDKSVMLDILSSNPKAQEEFISTGLEGLEEMVRFERTSRGWFRGKNVEARLRDSASMIGHVSRFLSVVKNDSQYKFHQKLRERKSSTKRINVVKDISRKSAAENFIQLASSKSVSDFFHYDNNKEVSFIGRKLRSLMQSLLPTFLKPLVYPEARLGKILKTRSFMQAAKILFRFIFYNKSFRQNLPNLMLVLDDINMGRVWNSPEQTQKAQINLIKNIISSDMLSNTLLLRDKSGNLKVDDNGEMIPNENAVDFIYSVLEIFSSKDEVRELIKYSNQILAILKKNQCLEAYENILYVDDPVKQKAELLKIAYRVSIEDFKKLELGLSKVRPIIERVSINNFQTIEHAVENPKPKYYFPHVGTVKKMDRLFALMQDYDGDGAIDVNRRIYKGKETDFSYGRFDGTEEDKVQIRNIRAKHFNATSSVFEHVDFYDSTLAGCRKENRSQFLFLGANFDHAKMNSSSFSKMELKSAYFDNVAFENCKFEDSNLSKSIFTESIFRRGEIRSCNMSDIDATNAVFEKSIIEDVSFESAILSGTSFWGSKLRNVNFTNAQMENANLSGATLTNCDLTGVNLTEIDLRDIKIEGEIKVSNNCITKAQKFLLQRIAKGKGNVIIIHPEVAVRGKHTKKMSRDVSSASEKSGAFTAES